VEQLEVGLKSLDFTYIEIGNPHCIIFSNNDIADSDFYQLGPQIEKHPKFPNGTNVEFVKIISKNEIKCRVWERGSGPTLACGTGACAVLAASNLNNFTNNVAKVHLPGGCLSVTWDKQNNHIFLNGPTASVFIGQINIELSDFY
jgi:diaminopimelate epimerase